MKVTAELHELLGDFRDYMLDHGYSTPDGKGVDREWIMRQSVLDFERTTRVDAAH